MTFQTRFPDRPMWKIVYDDLLSAAEIGDVVTYEQLRAALPDVDDAGVRGAFFRACREVELTMSRTFENVRTVGYRMVDAREHERLARAHHKRSRRQMGKALAKTRSADRSKLTPDERARLDSMELTLSRHAELIARLNSRVERNEKALQDARAATAAARRTASEGVAAVSATQEDLAARLARLEAAMSDRPTV
jgi:hypothetical protein